MAKDDVSFLFDQEAPPREWEEKYFGLFRPNRGGPTDVASLAKFLSETSAADLSALRDGKLTPYVYSQLLFVRWILERYINLTDSHDHEIFRIVGHLVSASLTPAEEKIWANASRAIGFVKPSLEVVVSLIIGELLRFNQTTLLADLFEFTYFSYREKLTALVENSVDYECWSRNIIDLIPYLRLHRITPTRIEILHWFPLLKRRMPFLSKERIQAMDEEAKRIEEIFANLYAVAALDLGKDQEISLGEKRREIHDINHRQGRIEALKMITYYHRNKLLIPTYLRDELKREI